jgi:invasion protein IalB
VISISILAAVSMAAVASVASSRPAASQQTPATGPSPAGTEIAPRGQREVKDIAYGDWKKLCFKPGAAKMICRTSIRRHVLDRSAGGPRRHRRA